jgi:hypothetical protein
MRACLQVNMNGQVLGSDGILSKVDQEVIFAQWLKFGNADER